MQLGDGDWVRATMPKAAWPSTSCGGGRRGTNVPAMVNATSNNPCTIERATLADRARGLLQDPGIVTWRCTGCRWELWCDFASRREEQTCEVCLERQHVPPANFAWNERLIGHQQECRERRRVRFEHDSAARMEREQGRRREQAARHASMRLAASTIAVEAGLASSAVEFERASDAEAHRILELAAMARALASDLRSARTEAASADGSERAVREGAGWGSLACLMFGSLWLAAGVSATSWATREITRDWKRARAARYRRRWEDALSRLTAEEGAAFARIFACLQPREAAAVAAMLAA